MFAPTIGEHLDIVDHIIPRFLTRRLGPMRRALSLQAPQKLLCDRVIQTIPLPTHTTLDPVVSQ